MTDSFPKRLLRHATENALFPEPGMALLAVSGGADSVALLFLMKEIAPELGLELAVAHVDHGIARDSADVAENVQALSDELGLVFHSRRLELGSHASETRARDARYAALREMQREAGARYLVTAHQQDDQIETVLYRALRGTGMAGLAGIPATGPDGLVRPLLPFTRRDLSHWHGERRTVHGVPFAVHRDPANLDARHDRSWLRQHVIPLLVERFGDDFGRHMEALARHASDERAAWSALLSSLPELEFRAQPGVIEVARGPLLGYDKMLSEAILRALARELGMALGADRARRVRELLASESGRQVPLGGGYVAEIAFDRLRLLAPADPGAPETTLLGDGAAGRVEWGNWHFKWRREAAGIPKRAALTTWVTPGTATIRPLGGGERVIPLGGVGHRKVRRLLMEARIPASERDAYPLCARDGNVIWIPGICRTDLDVPRQGETALRIEAEQGTG